MTPTAPTDVTIRTRPDPRCHVCGSPGAPLHGPVTDRIFSTPGEWYLRRCRSAACGLVWLDPMPVEEDIGKAYAGYFTHDDAPAAATGGRNWRQAIRDACARAGFGYSPPDPGWQARLAAAVIRLHPGMRDEMAFDVMWLPRLAGGRLLDVGCGSGRFIGRMRDLGWHAEGVDFDPEAARVGARHGLTVRVGGLADQGYPDASFDAVTMIHFIEHIFDPREVLAEAHRILRPGGRLVVITPNAAGLGHRVFGASWRPLEPPRHIHVFTPRALARLAGEAGFAEVAVRTMLCEPYGVVAGSARIRWQGRHDMRQPIGVAGRIAGRAMQLIESIGRVVFPDLGDEVMLMARKAAPMDAAAA